ncbi:MAG: glycosyltransferase family 2 protein [Candidatus Thermofonsia Clade 1 bacterium]|jgi:glycosyltransferase involved in cell wall biosynthesis|uniref:Glycosyltransferase family 2 protein n=1 Tax=Candidatus Thermofonsia Clade 1 bacterium TaxID=2364210 RepID=A0A2M8P402_9CHLR|nr:MAG: glycosyltransferase family 2 protein [Candidatus Thermofonsia Clade 1 bacterium]
MVSQETLQQAKNALAAPLIAVIPAFNEDRFIASVVLKARRHVDHVIVVDDGSQDETAWLAEAAGAEVIRQANSGKAAALNTGLAAAQARNAAAVILLDGDGQHDPNDIPRLLEPIQRGAADLVVGSRFMGLASNTPRWRIIGQQALTALTNAASGVALSDSQSGFRALSQRALSLMNFTSRGFSVESEMQFLMRQHNLQALEVPIRVNYDEKPKRNPFAHGFQVLTGVLRLVGQHRPLFFFGVTGMLAILIGLILGASVVSTYNTYSSLALGTALIAITLCIIGVFAIFTGVILHTIRAYMTER